MQAAERTALLALLPEPSLGIVEQLTPIRTGLSGAGVYDVKTSRDSYVLRVQGPGSVAGGARPFAQQLRVQRAAAEAGVAPPIVHVDEAAGAVVSRKVANLPIGRALGDPQQRPAVLTSIVEQLRRLHALDRSGVDLADPLNYARRAWLSNRERPGFPVWATSLEPLLDGMERALHRNSRRVVSHNDVNPMNLVWDGTRVWLVDWEVAALSHPHYDLAVLALFLRLDPPAAFELAAQHDGNELNAGERATFLALQKLAALLCGLTFLGLASDLTLPIAATAADTPTLADCYAALRSGTLDMQTPLGLATMGLALLAIGVREAGAVSK